MAFDADKAWVFWPEYFDSNRSKAEGRRVPKSLAIQDPTMEMVIKAVQRAGFQYKLEEGKSYPGSWWKKTGMLLVENTMPKPVTLRRVAEELLKVQRS